MMIEDFRRISWKELRDWDYQFLRHHKIMNGCGGAGDKVDQRLIRFILKWSLNKLRIIFIDASCDVHDYTYWQGGDENRRRECDLGFFTAIINDIDKANISVFKYTIIALIFYYAVRLGGKQYFNYMSK